MHKFMTVEMPDGSTWGVPVEMVARNRAEHYASEFGGDVERSLNEDTVPLFEADDYEIHDWASNNMDWSDFDGHQKKIADPPAPDFLSAWMSGTKGFAGNESETAPANLEAALELLLRRGYYPVAEGCAGEGAQLVDGTWYMPRYGCHTLQHAIDSHGDELVPSRPASCPYCDGTIEVEMDNNGPVGPCPVCN